MQSEPKKEQEVEECDVHLPKEVPYLNEFTLAQCMQVGLFFCPEKNYGKHHSQKLTLTVRIRLHT